ncbi:MAG TPA: SpoIIE family protein phosphatase [Solirubrobacterales bacterium]|nr:SpoIIE family protein phosphatase [Solirubrobacterales bacterium]
MSDDLARGDDPLEHRGEEEEGWAPGDTIVDATLAGLRRAAEEVEQIAAIAETLQRSLLSERLPEIIGLSLAARYRAGSADAQVGGDWYDVIPLRNGRAGIAIGDVVGHGIDAAARMAALKNALRAYALEGLRPSVLLDRMNNFVRELEGDAMATLLYCVVDVDERQLRLATAGHPPPLLIDPSDEAHYAEGRAGSPLGVVAFPRYEDAIIPLEPGSVALLYTDGLIERAGTSLDAGLEWLRGFARDAPRDPSELCMALLNACFGSSPPADDVALLVARIDPVDAGRIELTLRAEPESLAQMRRGVGRWLRGTGANDTEVYELLVACGEACSNAIAHAYPPGEASYWVDGTVRDGTEIELRVGDYGSWREPRAGSAGRGLVLIEKLVDRFEIDRGARGTVVTMARRLNSEVAA